MLCVGVPVHSNITSAYWKDCDLKVRAVTAFKTFSGETTEHTTVCKDHWHWFIPVFYTICNHYIRFSYVCIQRSSVPRGMLEKHLVSWVFMQFYVCTNICQPPPWLWPNRYTHQHLWNITLRSFQILHKCFTFSVSTCQNYNTLQRLITSSEQYFI